MPRSPEFHFLASPPETREWLDRFFVRRAWPWMRRAATAYRCLILKRTRVIVIVGTYGKTTTLRAVGHVLELPPPKPPWRNLTSHSALRLLRIPPWRSRALLEVGIGGPGEMEKYAQMIRPDLTIVTSIGSEHHTSLKDQATTAHEKAWMVRQLTSSGIAILNGDDDLVLAMARECRGRVVTFGRREGVDVRCVASELRWPTGNFLEVSVGGNSYSVQTRLVGEHMIYPVVAALAVAHTEGLDIAHAIRQIETLEPTEGRMMPVKLPGGAFLLRDDFKSNQETVETALSTLATLPGGRRFAVLGDLTEPADPWRQTYKLYGRLAAEAADRIIYVGENSKPFARGTADAGFPTGSISLCKYDLEAAARLVSQEMRPGDIILLKGRGAERLERIAIRLMGSTVHCALPMCHFRATCCKQCSLLASRRNAKVCAKATHPALENSLAANPRASQARS